MEETSKTLQSGEEEDDDIETYVVNLLGRADQAMDG